MVARQPEIVGREAELEAVEAFFADLRSPTGLLFEGEAGIGKTTLWRHAIEIAEEHGFRVLSCTGSSAETQLAFTALGDLVEGSLEEVLADLPAPQRTALEVALFLAEAEAPPDPQAVARAFLSSIRRLARDERVVIAVGKRLRCRRQEGNRRGDGPSRHVSPVSRPRS